MSKSIFENSHTENHGVPEVTAKQVFEGKDQLVVIDVRTAEEWSSELGYIEGAQLKTLGKDFEDYVSGLSKEQDIVVVCRSGRRSAAATLYLIEQGYSNTYNMQGGMIAWNEAGLAKAQK